MMQPKTIHIAGWLFADLLLGLAMLFITSMVGLPPPPPATTPPTATPTPTSTFTPTPLRTPGGPPVPPTPTLAVGMNPISFTVTFKTDPNLVPEWIRNPNSIEANAARNQLSQQIRQCFNRFNGVAQAGMVLTFGGNRKNDIGDKVAAEANELLKKEYPGVFNRERTIFKNLHAISSEPRVNGSAEMEIYFVSSPNFSRNPIVEFGSTCTPPPVWCDDLSGAGAQRKVLLNVYNWVGSASLSFELKGRRFEIRPAGGENPAFKCFQVEPGVGWRAEYGTFDSNGTVTTNADMSFCIPNEDRRLLSNCGGQAPPTPSPGK